MALSLSRVNWAFVGCKHDACELPNLTHFLNSTGLVLRVKWKELCAIYWLDACGHPFLQESQCGHR